MLKCAIIGLGGLGQMHLENMVQIERERGTASVAALCDVDSGRFTQTVETNLGGAKAIDMAPYRKYTDVDELLEKEALDFVISAVPTYLHAEIAIKALRRGLHTFSEKPMALTPGECSAMIAAARAAGRQLTIGHCLRFWPEYQALKQIVDAGGYGGVVKAEFTRYSPLPTWTWDNWMLDFDKSGGAALDLHVHDIDTICWLFGQPQWVSSRATHAVMPYDSITTAYGYCGKTVTAVGDWGMGAKYPFSMGFLVRLERATVSLDHTGLHVYTADGATTPPTGSHDAYRAEIEEFIRCIASGEQNRINPPEASADVIRIARAEMRSAQQNTPVML